METLDSVIDQTYNNWECIIIDDRSCDNTKDIISLYEQKDSRFKYFLRSESSLSGPSASRNIGIENARGEYFQFLDSDDLISPDKIQEQVRKLKSNADFSISTCKWGRFKNKLADAQVYKEFPSYADFGEPLNFLNSLPKSLNFFPIHCYLIKKEVIKKAGYWNEYLNFNEDAEFMARIITNSKGIGFVETGVAYYRIAIKDNVSEYNSVQKVRVGLESWKLIELYYKVRFGDSTNYYVKKAKGEFYLKIKNDFPELVKEEREFFSNQIASDPENSGFLKRFLRKKNLK